MSDIEEGMDHESDNDEMASDHSEGGESDAESDSSDESSSSSSSSSSSTSSSNSPSSPGDEENRQPDAAPVIVVPPKIVGLGHEERLSRELKQLTDVYSTLSWAARPVLNMICYPLLDAMADLLRLQEASPLANFVHCVQECVRIAQHTKLSKSGEVPDTFCDMPIDLIVFTIKEELSKWKRRADVRSVRCALSSSWKPLAERALCAAQHRGYGMLASRELEWVLLRQETWYLKDTELGSQETLIDFALEAWMVMAPHESEVRGTFLEHGLNSRTVEQWLAQDDVLESLSRWRLLRVARSELLSMEDTDMVRNCGGPGIPRTVVGKVSMMAKRKRGV